MRNLLTAFFCICFITVQAQNAVIHGSIKDGVNNKSLKGASIILLHAKDSILCTFTRAGEDGSFILKPDSPGRFVLLITFPGFADFTDEITAAPGDNNLGIIPLSTRAKLLEDVVFTRKMGAIKIVGDTTEYNADSFKVKDGATVEDLLKKLPGLQVDKNGKITAQGETVQKVLVDGEEFFSDDPAVVTRNLQSKAVDAVQVYDKKSDQAIFSGIDDGEKTKTINLKLKDNMKHGYFGKLEAGGGTDGYFNNQAMINGFKGKRQLSAFGIMSNTGTVGLNWEDRSKYSSTGTPVMSDDDNMIYFNNADDDLDGDWRGNFSGNGLPTVWTGGLHYANKWNGDNEHLNGNYRYSRNNVETENNSFTQYILPDSQYFSRQREETFTSGERHGGDARFEWKRDTNTNITISAEGNLIHNISRSDSYTETLGGDGGLINSSARQLNNDANSQNLTASLLWKQKLAKKGRNFSIGLDEKYRASDGVGYLYADNEFYTAGGVSDTVNQRKTAKTMAQNLSGKISYTEPLSKTTFLTVDYGLGLSINSADRFSYNRGGAEWNDAPDSLYSSSYHYNVITNSGGAKVQWITKKWTLGAGARLYNTAFHQDDLLRDTSFNRNYNNFAPSANVTWNISKQRSLRFNYNGATNQPTLNQIQPLLQNDDPLNIAIGNPSLKQEFQHKLSLNYHSYKPLSNTYTYGGGGLNFVQDDISQAQNTDAFGRRTYQYINVNGDYNGYLYGGTGMKYKKLDVQIGVNGNINLSHAANYVNGLRNISNNNVYSASISISKDWEKNDKTIAGIEFEPGIGYNDNHSTISTLATSFWNSSSRLEVYTDIFWKLRISSTVRTELRQRTADFDRNNNVVRWDAALSKKFLKKDALELRASVFDILNQNLGYNRAGENNYISEQRYNTIRRYGMLSLIWNFTKSPDTAPAAGVAK